MTPVIISYSALGAAIVSEVLATSLLPHTREFTRPVPTIFMTLLYGAAFYLLTIAIRMLPISIAYALWSGLGMVLIAGVNYFVLKQVLDLPALLGIGMIIAGVVTINLFSNTVPH